LIPNVNNSNITSDHLWCDCYDFDDTDNQIKLNKQNLCKINLKKELAKDIIDSIDYLSDTNYDSIVNYVDQTTDVDTLDIIIRSLNKSYCYNHIITIILLLLRDYKEYCYIQYSKLKKIEIFFE